MDRYILIFQGNNQKLLHICLCFRWPFSIIEMELCLVPFVEHCLTFFFKLKIENQKIVGVKPPNSLSYISFYTYEVFLLKHKPIVVKSIHSIKS